MTEPAGAEVQREVERFFHEEAVLIDERKLHLWLALFTDDAVYRMELRSKILQALLPNTLPTAGTQVLFEDDKRFLTLRVRRLETGMAHAEKPPSITRHLVTNIIADLDGPAVIARSNFHVYQARLEADDMHFFGKREDRLLRTDAGWRIARRSIVLDHIVVPRTLTTFF
ncbi:MAG TPA: aromatic-ring-hydroxylating dioxygenase subunit beta [Candidatus Limnocylindria bacterium]|nr:aromatic-ring-hydroxylating dioxygenase subunit beta [Candidatus Limnocylindria bacterium]